MVRWVIGSITHGGPIELFLAPACALQLRETVIVKTFIVSEKAIGMCYPVCGMLHIKDPLLLIGVSSFVK